MSGKFKNGNKEGFWAEYHESSDELTAKGHYKNGKRESIWNLYSKNSQLINVSEFKRGA